MKGLSKFFGLALALVGAGLITSCSSENAGEPDNTLKGGKVGFAKAPEVWIWSGSQDLYGTRAEAEEGDVNTVEVADEVEVNLAINDSHVYEDATISDLVSKLSIHVRYGHDVKVRIPVPVQYVVPVDDMDIVLSHKELDEVWKQDPEANATSYTFEELGKTIKLYVNYYSSPEAEGASFAEADYDSYAQGYICISTEGIDDEVMEYVYSKYGDGLNFEVWNYYNKPEEDAISRAQLNGYLNLSSIDFGGVVPGKYVNAFMLPYDDAACVDHWVYITGEGALNGYGAHTGDRALFNDGYETGYHKNGRPYNHIYTKKVVEVPAE